MQNVYDEITNWKLKQLQHKVMSLCYKIIHNRYLENTEDRKHNIIPTKELSFKIFKKKKIDHTLP